MGTYESSNHNKQKKDTSHNYNNTPENNSIDDDVLDVKEKEVSDEFNNFDMSPQWESSFEQEEPNFIENLQEVHNKVIEKANQEKNFTIKTGKTFAKIGKFFVIVFTNPVTYIGLALVLITLILMSTLHVYGSNDNNCLDNGSSEKINLIKDASREDNASEFMRFLMSYKFEALGGKSMNKLQAAALAGNAAQESGFNPEAENKSSHAFGLFQWLGIRRERLEAWASEHGKDYRNAQTQMEFFDFELQEWEHQTMNILNDFDKYDTTEEWTKDFYNLFERGGADQYGDRESFSKDFSTLTVNGSTKAGTKCKKESPALDMSDMVKLAISVSWPLGTPESVSNVPSHGIFSCPTARSYATKEYIELREKQFNEGPVGHRGGLDAPWFADCGRFVGSVVIMSGTDPDFPHSSTAVQEPYMQNSPKWKSLGVVSSFDELEPGDIGMKSNPGHIVMYVGEVDGTKHTIAQASQCQYTPRLSEAWSGQLKMRWYRYVG